MNLTGSIASLVGPAVTRTVLPAISCLGFSKSTIVFSITAGSAIFPFPTSPQARRPSAGGIIIYPSSERSLIFLCRTGFSYIFVFIAGATRTFALVAMMVVESISSAMPFASFPIIFAVAGAITITSASLARDICSISQ